MGVDQHRVEVVLLDTTVEHLPQLQHHQEAAQTTESVQQDTTDQLEQETHYNVLLEHLIQILKVHHQLHDKHAQQEAIVLSQIFQLLKVLVQ